MDKFGVPKKINRHVIKAIYQLHQHSPTDLNLTNVCETVNFSMQNNVPVPNLRNVVRQSFQNFLKLGIIKKNGRNYEFCYDKVDADTLNPASAPRIRLPKRQGTTKSSCSLDPNNRKRRRRASEDSYSETDPSNSTKRLGNKKQLLRKGQKVPLPKAREIDSYSDIEHDAKSCKEEGMGMDSSIEIVDNDSDSTTTFDTEIKIETNDECPNVLVLYENERAKNIEADSKTDDKDEQNKEQTEQNQSQEEIKVVTIEDDPNENNSKDAAG